MVLWHLDVTVCQVPLDLALVPPSQMPASSFWKQMECVLTGLLKDWQERCSEFADFTSARTVVCCLFGATNLMGWLFWWFRPAGMAGVLKFSFTYMVLHLGPLSPLF